MNEPEPARAISADEWRQIVDSAVGTVIITMELGGRVPNPRHCRSGERTAAFGQVPALPEWRRLGRELPRR